MKKLLIGLSVASIVSIYSTTAYAAEIQLKINGTFVASDVKPEIKNNRTMVPLRIISENLGASVEWTKSEVIITKNGMKVKLKTNNSTAEIDGTNVQLDVKPYVKNNRVFVPLRFIAETFDCNVDYKNFSVTIDAKQSKPLVINGVQVKAMQQEYRMTMGGVIQQIQGNNFNEKILKIITDNKGEKVEAPENYSWTANIDVPGSYHKNAQYDFLDENGTSLARYDVYTLVEALPAELLNGYPKVLIHDVPNNEWYLFNNAANQELGEVIDAAAKSGSVTIISNTVV
ncbi:MAG TPA: stalk domain-containing protein [Paenibacillus sp.]|nr:stalk domain-containing protein [Paenibacillus sp.]